MPLRSSCRIQLWKERLAYAKPSCIVLCDIRRAAIEISPCSNRLRSCSMSLVWKSAMWEKNTLRWAMHDWEVDTKVTSFPLRYHNTTSFEDTRSLCYIVVLSSRIFNHDTLFDTKLDHKGLSSKKHISMILRQGNIYKTSSYLKVGINLVINELAHTNLLATGIGKGHTYSLHLVNNSSVVSLSPSLLPYCHRLLLSMPPSRLAKPSCWYQRIKNLPHLASFQVMLCAPIPIVLLFWVSKLQYVVACWVMHLSEIPRQRCWIVSSLEAHLAQRIDIRL